jgi:hypothetical protein
MAAFTLSRFGDNERFHPQVEIFYSYSHKDGKLRDQLEKSLSILKSERIIAAWHDRKIGVSEDWSGQIDEHVKSAQIILLLVSADFLASGYCYDIEVRRAMERHEAGEALVVPVILRPVDWSGAPFGKLQALPSDAKPITSWSNRDAAFSDVVTGVRRLAEGLGSRRSVEAWAKRAERALDDLPDADLWPRLSPSARMALARAEGVRRAIGKEQVHTYQLIVGLFPEWQGFFAKAGVDYDALKDIIQRAFRARLPDDFPIPDLSALPTPSANVRRALNQAAKRAVERGSRAIWSADLLYGVLSLTESKTVQALKRRGLRREDIHVVDGPESQVGVEGDPGADQRAAWASRRGAGPWTGLEAPPEVQPAAANSAPSVQHTSSTPMLEEPIPPLLRPTSGEFPYPGAGPQSANPTPKVASDLWCREDRLGYEAYARTIAELITHEETVAPLTIGIKAPWGAGKTSLMKRVQELLDGGATVNEAGRAKILEDSHPQLTLREMLARLKDSTKPMGLKLKRGKDYNFPPRITVWFNAWKYQTSEQVWAGMAHCIINQVTARMSIRDRELFWLRLHARRVNADEVRKKVYESVARQLWPIALVVFVGCVAVIWMASGVHDVSIQRFIQGGAIFASLAGMIWKAWDKLGDKAAETVKEMVREPGYEGKMGYLHLVESDMRDVLELVTEAQQPPEEATSGAKAPAGKKDSIAALEALRHPKSASPAKGPLVVFVDDLDRCAPNKVADVVEAINLFLCGDYPNCIFVLGMEPGMVAAALEVANKDVIQKAEEMGLTDQSVPVGWRFMEKIIQLPIMIPPPTKGGRDSYVQSLTGVHEFNAYMAKMVENVPKEEFRSQLGLTMPSSLSEFEKVRRAAQEPLKEEDVAQFKSELTGLSLSEVVEKSNKVLAEVPLEKRRAAAEASKRAYAEAFVERDPLMGKFVTDVAQLVDGNPRQIKRYVNVFRFYSTLRHSLQVDGVASREELPSDEMMAKFVALSVHWPHAMDCLRKKDAKASEANGRKVTLLESLESESRKTPAEVATVDVAWEKFVGKEGLGLGAWAMRPAFREFLSRGESLFQNEGHGLW